MSVIINISTMTTIIDKEDTEQVNGIIQDLIGEHWMSLCIAS